MATVLLVDDSALIRHGVGHALEQAGFEVLFATDGEQALEIARRSLPDLILLDLFLPKLNGWDVLNELKNLPLTAKVPVIVLTSLAQSEAELGRADVSVFFEKAKLDLVRGSEELIRVVGTPLEPPYATIRPPRRRLPHGLPARLRYRPGAAKKCWSPTIACYSCVPCRDAFPKAASR